jgi:hypothetical protein
MFYLYNLILIRQASFKNHVQVRMAIRLLGDNL